MGARQYCLADLAFKFLSANAWLFVLLSWTAFRLDTGIPSDHRIPNAMVALTCEQPHAHELVSTLSKKLHGCMRLPSSGICLRTIHTAASTEPAWCARP